MPIHVFGVTLTVWRLLLAIPVIAILIPLFFLVVNRDAFLQKYDTVSVRQDGHLRLGKPENAGPLATEELTYARLSEAAYQKAEAAAAGARPAATNSDVSISGAVWHQWPDFFATTVEDEFKKHHLRISVWENTEQKTVVVGFGGTVPNSIPDWIANFRWFIPRHDDQYTQVVKTFGPVFCDEFKRHNQIAGSNVKLIATGHSLGGGLAQEFAYSLPPDPAVPRVSHVYAFDPSPVTGYFSVKRCIRDENKKVLDIDRIYQRREVLAILRSFINLIHRPSASNPTVREIRYNFQENWNPVMRHSISDLSGHLECVVERAKTMTPAQQANTEPCPVQE